MNRHNKLFKLRAEGVTPISAEDAIDWGFTGPALRAARAKSPTIPIVAIDLESEPLEGGIAASLARPGGYTRILKLHTRRLGDAGEQALIELLKEGEVKVKATAPAPASHCKGNLGRDDARAGAPAGSIVAGTVRGAIVASGGIFVWTAVRR